MHIYIYISLYSEKNTIWVAKVAYCTAVWLELVYTDNPIHDTINVQILQYLQPSRELNLKEGVFDVPFPVGFRSHRYVQVILWYFALYFNNPLHHHICPASFQKVNFLMPNNLGHLIKQGYCLWILNLSRISM